VGGRGVEYEVRHHFQGRTGCRARGGRMKWWIRRVAAIAALLGAPVMPAWAVQPEPGEAVNQETGQPTRLSLDQAVARGLELSEEVAAAQAQQDLAESQVVQARAGALPQVSGQLGYNRTLASLFDGITFGGPAEGEE